MGINYLRNRLLLPKGIGRAGKEKKQQIVFSIFIECFGMILKAK